MTNTPTPTPDRIRLTITVTPEVHASFQRLAKATGMSIGRTMGEWLGDTIEAVEFTALKVEQARSAPGVVMREMHAYALGLLDEVGEVQKAIRKASGHQQSAKRADAQSGGVVPFSPPSSNTGGKVPQSGGNKSKGART